MFNYLQITNSSEKEKFKEPSLSIFHWIGHISNLFASNQEGPLWQW